jgi:hypothetical protein
MDCRKKNQKWKMDAIQEKNLFGWEEEGVRHGEPLQDPIILSKKPSLNAH